MKFIISLTIIVFAAIGASAQTEPVNVAVPGPPVDHTRVVLPSVPTASPSSTPKKIIDAADEFIHGVVDRL